jgi:hypothetical protein
LKPESLLRFSVENGLDFLGMDLDSWSGQLIWLFFDSRFLINRPLYLPVLTG